MPDNTMFAVNGQTLERLRATLELALEGPIAGYSNDNSVVTLYRHVPASAKGVMELPVPVPVAHFVAIVQAWLATATYPKQPDHDGDNKKGWLVQIEDQDWTQVVTIRPTWMMYGK